MKTYEPIKCISERTGCASLNEYLEELNKLDQEIQQLNVTIATKATTAQLKEVTDLDQECKTKYNDTLKKNNTEVSQKNQELIPNYHAQLALKEDFIAPINNILTNEAVISEVAKLAGDIENLAVAEI